MKVRIDMDKIARGLGAQRRGKVAASGGYFGAMQLLGEARFRVPPGGGRPTDATWMERSLVPLAPRTLKRLEEIAAKVRAHGGVSIEPMQLAALLLEKKAEELSEGEAESLVSSNEPMKPPPGCRRGGYAVIAAAAAWGDVATSERSVVTGSSA